MYSHAISDEKIETMSKTKLFYVSQQFSKDESGEGLLRDNRYDERICDASDFEKILQKSQNPREQTDWTHS
jgi:hypothetical protein